MTRQRCDLRDRGAAADVDHALALELVRVTEAAAISASRWIGHGAEHAGAAAAAAAACDYLMRVPMRGVVVLGDPGPDVASGLSEHAGDGTGPVCDVGISTGDPALSEARDVPRAVAAIAVAERGGMYAPPSDVPMQKLVVGADSADVVDIRRPVAENLRAIAAVTGSRPSELTVAVLNRPHHGQLVRDIRATGARVHLLEGGEIAGAVAAAHPESPIDVLLGTGCGADGVLAAAGVSCLGGGLQAVLWPDGSEEREHAGPDADRVLHAGDLVQGRRILFCATGVTGNELLRGVGRNPDHTRTGCRTTESAVMCSDPSVLRSVRSEHRPV